MGVYMRRLKDDTTQVRTDSSYLVDLLANSGIAKFVKVSRIGTTFILAEKLENIPSNVFKFADYLKKLESN